MAKPIKPEQMEFSRADFDSYKTTIDQYIEKYVREGFISDEGIVKFNVLNEHLVKLYTPKSLDQYRICRNISAILNRHNRKRQYLRDLESMGEIKTLESEIQVRDEEGTLTPEHRETIHEKINGMKRKLDPTHFHEPHY